MNIKKWPFKDKLDVISITTKGIVEEGKTILYVTHDKDDGMWQFHDGTILKEEDARIVSLKEVYELDPSIGNISNIPCGWHAWRDSKDGEWNVCKKESM